MANDTAIAVLNKTKQSVMRSLEEYINKGQIVMPLNYSYGNALNLLQLQIQDDPNIMSCTTNSIAKAMLDMAIMGLNCSKSQAYIIPYGNQAKLHVSYLGKVALAKRIDPTIDNIVGRAVKTGEDFEFEDLTNGYSKIVKHKRTLQSMDSKGIIGAYATIVYKDGKDPKSLIMTIDRIKKSWSMSKMRPVQADGSLKPGGVHDKFTDDMAVKTVISAICKMIISTSDDSSMFYDTVNSVEIEEVAAMEKEEISEKNGAGEYIDIDYEDVPAAGSEEDVDNYVDNVSKHEEIVETEETDTMNLFCE